MFPAMSRGLTRFVCIGLLAILPASGRALADEAPKVIGQWQSARPPLPYFLAISPDGTTLAVGGMHGGLYIWDVVKGEVKHTLDDGASRVDIYEGIIAFSADGKTLAVLDAKTPAKKGSTSELHLRIWDVGSGKLVREIKDINELKLAVGDRFVHIRYACLALSPDGTRLAAHIDGQKSISVWNTADGRVAATFAVKTLAACLTFTPDGKALVAQVDSQLLMYDLSKKQAEVILDREPSQSAFDAAGFTPDARTFVTFLEVLKSRGKRRPALVTLRLDFWSIQAHSAKHPNLELDTRQLGREGRAIASDTATLALKTGPQTIDVFDSVTRKTRTSVEAAHPIDCIGLSRSGATLRPAASKARLRYGT